jgi:hypothetical protein
MSTTKVTTKKRKKKKKLVKYNVGDTIEVESFAGPRIYQKVLEKVKSVSEYSSLGKIVVKGCWGRLVRRKDLYALKKHCVPYTGKEKLSKTKSFSYDWQVIRVVKKATK